MENASVFFPFASLRDCPGPWDKINFSIFHFFRNNLKNRFCHLSENPTSANFTQRDLRLAFGWDRRCFPRLFQKSTCGSGHYGSVFGSDFRCCFVRSDSFVRFFFFQSHESFCICGSTAFCPVRFSFFKIFQGIFQRHFASFGYGGRNFFFRACLNHFADTRERPAFFLRVDDGKF